MIQLNYTGHPLFDVGLAAITALVPIFLKAMNCAFLPGNQHWVFLSHLKPEKMSYHQVGPFASTYH